MYKKKFRQWRFQTNRKGWRVRTGRQGATTVDEEVVSPTVNQNRIGYAGSASRQSQVSQQVITQDSIRSSYQAPQHNQLVDLHLTSLAATSSPAFRTGSRLSSNSYPGSFVDPFAAEDGSVPGRGRKRTKFARPSGAWRLEDSDSDVEVITQNGAYTYAQVGPEHHVIDLTEDRMIVICAGP